MSFIGYPADFVGRNMGISTHHPGNAKGFGKWNLASVKSGVRSGRFFRLTTRAAPRIRLFALTIIVVPTLSAQKSRLPLFFSKESQAGIFVGKTGINGEHLSSLLTRNSIL